MHNINVDTKTKSHFYFFMPKTLFFAVFACLLLSSCSKPSVKTTSYEDFFNSLAGVTEYIADKYGDITLYDVLDFDNKNYKYSINPDYKPILKYFYFTLIGDSEKYYNPIVKEIYNDKSRTEIKYEEFLEYIDINIPDNIIETEIDNLCKQSIRKYLEWKYASNYEGRLDALKFERMDEEEGKKTIWDDSKDGLKKSFLVEKEDILVLVDTQKKAARLSSKDITIPNDTKEIVDEAFAYSFIVEHIKIPENVTKIGRRAFNKCIALKSIEIPDSVTTIGEEAFANCEALETAMLPNSVNKMGKGVFKGCTSLKSVTFSENVTIIKDETFAKCKSLKNITIPKHVTHIGSNAFNGCTSLENIVISESVTGINDCAFIDCKSLKNVTIKNSRTRIAYNAFRGCSNLKNISVAGQLLPINKYNH